MAVASNDAWGKPLDGWRLRLYTIIFEADTRAGRLFDQWLIAIILASVTVVVLDSVHGINARLGTVFDILEWGFTLVFTVEYVARLLCVRHPLRYALSFYGVIDLLALLPTYLALLVPGVPGLSANIQVRSLVGRFLEHTRACYFENDGGEPIILAGSADWMPRNFDKRFEVMIPIESLKVKKKLLTH